MLKFLRTAMTRRRKGAIAILAVVAILPITAMVSAHVNTGQMMEDRRRSQDAADALAMMHATWSARSLNVISMNNITTTQVLTVAVGTEALEATLQEFAMTVAKTKKWLKYRNALCWAQLGWVPYVGQAAAKKCTKWNDAAIGWVANAASAYIAYVEARWMPLWGRYKAHQALKALDGMNEAIAKRFPLAIRDLGKDYASVYGIEDFHFVDACARRNECGKRQGGEGMALPVTKQVAYQRIEMCDAMMGGGKSRGGFFKKRYGFIKRNFPAGQGPMSHGGAGRTHVRDYIEDTTDIDWALMIYKNYYDLFPLAFALPVLPRRLPSANNLQGSQNFSTNTFVRSFDSKLNTLHLCPGYGKNHSFGGYNLSFALKNFLGTVPQTWWPEGALPRLPGATSAQKMDDAYRVLVVTQARTSRHLSSKLLNSQSIPQYGHAQATIFNPDGADLYTPAWRAKLTPASRMEKPGPVATDLRQHAKPDFRPLARALEGVRAGTSWSKINAH